MFFSVSLDFCTSFDSLYPEAADQILSLVLESQVVQTAFWQAAEVLRPYLNVNWNFFEINSPITPKLPSFTGTNC